MITLNASVNQVSQVSQVSKYFTPVSAYVFDKVMKLMETANIIWDGTLNHIDAFLKASDNHRELIYKLTPSKKEQRARKMVYVEYFW